jgi:DUF4097 and DUF4098 domain-containing protein YvlB
MTLWTRLAAIAVLAAIVAAPAAAQDSDGGGRAGRRGLGGPDRLRVRQDAIRERQAELRRARQAARIGPSATETVVKTVKLERSGAFSLENVSGTVTVTGGSGDRVRIEAVKRAWQRTEADARALLGDVDVDIAERSGSVTVQTVLPAGTGLSVDVDYTVTVPSSASVSIRTVAGDVRVADIRGELRIESASSSITASTIAQLRSVRTVSGAIQLDNVESDDMVASSLGGSVTIRGLKARSVDLRSVNGDVRIVDGDAERVTAQTLSGRVEFSGKVARAGRYSLQSRTGDVRFAAGADDDFDLEATTLTGTLRSDVAVTLDERRAERGARRGGGARGRGGRVMRGLAGQGGALVTLRTVSGSIVVARSERNERR